MHERWIVEVEKIAIQSAIKKNGIHFHHIRQWNDFRISFTNYPNFIVDKYLFTLFFFLNCCLSSIAAWIAFHFHLWGTQKVCMRKRRLLLQFSIVNIQCIFHGNHVTILKNYRWNLILVNIIEIMHSLCASNRAHSTNKVMFQKRVRGESPSICVHNHSTMITNY